MGGKKLIKPYFFLVVINILSIILMGVDKRRAKRRQHRVSENTLWLFAICFGSLGVWVGMKLFNHKTKKKKFVYGVPVVLIAQVFILSVFFSGLGELRG